MFAFRSLLPDADNRHNNTDDGHNDSDNTNHCR